MAKKIKDQFYMTIYHGLVKGGITGNAHTRFSNSSYNAGGFDNEAHVLYWALPGHEEHILTLEKFYKRKFFDFLKKSEKDPSKALEYIDSVHKHITISYVQRELEEKIKSHPLKIMKLKEIYLPSLRIDAEFAEKVRANPTKYLENI